MDTRADTTFQPFNHVNVGEFKLYSDDFGVWSERLKLSITVNNIPDVKKVPYLLSLLGNDGYTLMRDLCVPDSPSCKTFDDLIKIMKDHLSPKPNVMTERYKFKESKQINESISAYVVTLKKLSSTCGFGANLDTALRDQFVWGIRDSNMKKHLLNEVELTFARAVELSIAMETTNQDVMQYSAGTASSTTYEMQYVNRSQTSGGEGRSEWSK